MTYCTMGMAQFDRSLVIDACDRYISLREKTISHRRERFIQKVMRPKKWFFGLIHVNGRTRAQAEALWEQSDGFISPADEANLEGIMQFRDVCNLRMLAINSEQPLIYVSTDMAFLFEIS